MFAKVGTVTVVALAALAVATERLILHPVVPPPPRVDAVFVLAGGGPRTEAARSLMRDGLTDVMYVSDGGESRFDLVPMPCPGRNEHCFTPDPPTTQGEARAIRDIVREHRWSSIAVLTKRAHVTRARTLLQRCVEAQVHMVVLDRQATLADVLHEWGGLGKATLWRGC